MNISETTTIGDLVAADYRTAGVFKARGIDFCCQGKRSIAEACKKNRLNAKAMINELEAAINKGGAGAGIDFQSWPADLLVDYIEKKHHRYVASTIPELRAYLHKVVEVHGAKHPELELVEAHFASTASALTAHMKKEELILFPFIKQLTSAELSGKVLRTPFFGRVGNPIAMLHEEHDAEGARFREMAKLTHNYTPPEDACNTYKVCLSLLQEFEADLHMHIHLENNILFPKAMEMEVKLLLATVEGEN